MTTTVAMLLFEDCDVMDVTGPYEVLLTANRLAVRRDLEPPFDVRTVSLEGTAVTAHGGLGLVPSHGALADVDPLDVLLVPGLIDLGAGLDDDHLVAAVRSAGGRAGTVASVCTGAFLLDAAGLLAGHDATTHWEDVPALTARREAAGDPGRTRADVRWVDAGTVLTGGALTDGIDMALHLVERTAGRDLAEATAHQLDHRWTEDR